MIESVTNSQGKIFYGMHFYPGVARYEAPDQEPLTVFINESTIRKMGPSFAGRPIFVDHVAEVDGDINELRGDADGWVVESFFNAADGKTWAKFIIVSDRGLRAIQHGFKLSNAYIPELRNQKGTWNGVDYQQEVVGGEFEHLAIVQNPRYEESVIMSPEQFKAYNDEKTIELKRLANSKDKKGEKKMGFEFFKRSKVENSADVGGMMVKLPKSKKEMFVTDIIEEHDKFLNMHGYANGDHLVKVGNDEMSVNDLVKKHIEAQNSMEEAKKNAAREDGGEPGPDDKDAKDPAIDNDDQEKRIDVGVKDVDGRGGDKSVSNDDQDSNKEEDDKKEKNVKNAKMTLDEARLVIAKEKADRLKNAGNREPEEEITFLSLPKDQVAKGKARYGSGN